VAPPVSHGGSRTVRMAAAIFAVAYLVAMVITGALPQQRQRVEFEARGVLEAPPESVQEVVLRSGGAPMRWRRDADGWTRVGGSVLPAQAASTLSRAVKFMHTSAPVRVFQPSDVAGSSPAEFGLQQPRLSVELFSASGPALAADFGDLNADGFLQYMRVRGREQLFLMSRFVGAEWSAVAATQAP